MSRVLVAFVVDQHSLTDITRRHVKEACEADAIAHILAGGQLIAR